MTNPTDSDRATAERIVEEWREGLRGLSVYGDALALRDAIAAAIAAERDACAKVAEALRNRSKMSKELAEASGDLLRAAGWNCRISEACDIAAAIRARSNPN